MRHGTILKEMGQVQQELDEIFGQFGFGNPLRQYAKLSSHTRCTLRLNLSEDADNLYLDALLPGIDPAQIEMNIFGDTLSLSAERPAVPDEDNPGTLLQRERSCGTFQRKIKLPVQVVAEQATAEYRQGLLRVTLPKAVAAEPKKIEVKVC